MGPQPGDHVDHFGFDGVWRRWIHDDPFCLSAGTEKRGQRDRVPRCMDCRSGAVILPRLCRAVVQAARRV